VPNASSWTINALTGNLILNVRECDLSSTEVSNSPGKVWLT
jgi:hypothetical protein